MNVNVARTERAALCDLLLEIGPDGPTLCGSWTTRDLTAHLVVRESRVDAALGMVIGRLAGHTERVQAEVARLPWEELVGRVRQGPPRLSPFALPGVDARANLGEYYVHHEDVRRALEPWEPRAADGERYRSLETMLMKMGRMLLRDSPVTIRFDPGTGQPFVARSVSAHGGVTVVGTPDELALWTFGRESVALVEFIGSDRDIAAVQAARRGI